MPVKHIQQKNGDPHTYRQKNQVAYSAAEWGQAELKCRVSHVIYAGGAEPRSGSGITIRLLCPLSSTDRTPKITLSLDSFKSDLVSVVRVMFSVGNAASVVLRHKTS